MDFNTTILLAVLSLCVFIWGVFIVVSGGGIYYYMNKDKFTYKSKTEQVLKEITCAVKMNPDSIQCTSIGDTTKNLDITEGKILKISYTDEPKSKTSSEIVRYYYIMLPYYFSVELPIEVGNGNIKINTLDDLLKAFDNAEKESYKLIEKVPDKCLAVKVDLRQSKPPYNTTCIFFDGGFSAIDSISDIFLKAILKSRYIQKNIIEEYYRLLESKVNNDSKLSLFDYCMYIATFKYLNEDKYKYISLCNSERNIEC